MVSKVERMIAGKNLTIETGKIARQADGAVLVTYGETVVLVTAVADTARPDIDFFPLTVEYKEKQYAAGKFPGGVIKREGRPTTKEILTMRMTDRPIRPLFPEDYVEEVQIIALVLSADKDNDPDVLCMVGASAALSISGIPFQGPTGSCRVGLVDDEFVVNPTYAQREKSELELIVSGKADAIVMVEGCANVIPEEDVLTAIGVAQDENVELVSMIAELAEKCGKPTKAYKPVVPVGPVLDLVRPAYEAKMAEAHRIPDKIARQEAMRAVRAEAIEALCNADDANAPTERQIKAAFQKLEGLSLRKQIIAEGVRLDNRAPNDLRKIDCEVGVLPRTHGSALFTRGETQAFVITTLGTVSDAQRVLDPLIDEDPKKFMLHYNFPPSSVGEVRPIRGPGRREIGHGDLAERALAPVLPDAEEFPYTIRIVSDITESNGSSSMASVCGGTLSLMDAGVPIKNPVAGLSVGLIMEDGKQVMLTDICGAEDHFGDMDFKLAGTQNGLTALQLDLKVAGVDRQVLADAMMQAKDARLDILKTMLQTLRQPRPELSQYAPRLLRMTIEPDSIGKLIGPGGKMIRSLESEWNCSIDVEDDGSVTLATAEGGDMKGLSEFIKRMMGGASGIEVGKVYNGKVTELKDFGAIVELVPGTDGLCHVSELDEGYVRNVQDVCNVGDEMAVKVLAIDGNRIKLSRKAAMQEKPAEH